MNRQQVEIIVDIESEKPFVRFLGQRLNIRLDSRTVADVPRMIQRGWR